MKIETYIEKFNPCEASQPFLKHFSTFQEAWMACDREVMMKHIRDSCFKNLKDCDCEVSDV